jgi:Right handed beta helix region/Periplasmic copper-binding protein (NosD)
MAQSRGLIRRLAGATTALLLGGGVTLVAATPVSASTTTAIYASPSGTSGGAGTSCATATFTTISAAVAAATPGDTVVACAGTYTEDVVIPFRLTLIGESATINAAGLSGAPTGSILGQAPYNGITIEASHVTVEGFTVEGAEGEGILAVNPHPRKGPMIEGMQLYTGKPLTDVTIEDNIVEGNDVGFNDPSSPYFICTPNGGSDCGEGIHLESVAHSSVIDNQSVANAGGILLTDEYGPNHNNLIEGNYVEGNTRDCGITIPSHNLGLNPKTDEPDPSFGGDYDNQILDNQVIANGVEGYGAGVGVFAPESFTASYDNVVSGNLIEGNGLAGISVHSHQANAYVNGNVFTDNTIGQNNVDLADGTDTTPTDGYTTGILIWSDATPYKFTVENNRISDDTYGVWLTPATVIAPHLGRNHYSVTTPVFDAS